MKQFLYLVVSGVFLVIACTPKLPWKEPDELNLPILSTDTSTVSNFQCITYCSETKLRTGMALLTWSADEGLIGKQRIDVTVYKKGFETKMYTILWPLKKSQTFQTSRLVKLPDRPDMQLLYLDVNQADIDKQEGLISIELEGLQAGLNYFWRVLTLEGKGWVPGGIIRCQGPVCPADIEETHIVR
jgi:hypothetical protein